MESTGEAGLVLFDGKLRWLIWFFFFGLCCAAQTGERKALLDPDKLLKAITQTLASDEMAGREQACEGHAKAMVFLETQMRDLGIQPFGEKEGQYQHRFSQGTNLIGVMYPEGRQSEKPTVLIGAHFDHLAKECETDNLAQSAICNGATDNAAGVAAVLVAALKIKDRMGSPVVIALWDGEERGLLGSTAFVRKPTFALKSLKLVMNLDVVGLNLFKGLEHWHLAIGAETGGTMLLEHVALAADKAELNLAGFSYAFGHQRSDHTSFVLSPGGGIPSVFFTDGDGSQYHSCGDEVGLVNFSKVARVSAVVAELGVAASQEGTRFSFSPPQRQNGNFLPTFDDIDGLLKWYEAVWAVREQNGFDLDQLDILKENQKWMRRMKRAGPDKFTIQEAQFLGEAARSLTRISREAFRKSP